MSEINNDGPAFPIPLGPGQFWNEKMEGCDGMTLRQYAAINLRVPQSGTDWLDEMIIQSLRMDAAEKAIQACHEISDQSAMTTALWAFSIADAMIRAKEIPSGFQGCKDNIPVISNPQSNQAATSSETDGWIEWNGGECPVSGNTIVQIKMRDGVKDRDLAKSYSWSNFGIDGDIIAYRVVQEGGAE